MQFTPIIKK